MNPFGLFDGSCGFIRISFIQIHFNHYWHDKLFLHKYLNTQMLKPLNNQYIKAIKRIDRLLPVGNRVRSDVSKEE